MLNRRAWVKVGASVAFLAAATCCAVVSLQVLCNKNDKKAGIITFNFNFANGHLPNNHLVSRAVSERDIIPPVPSEAQSVVSGAATAVSSAASHAKSVASTVATAISGADGIIPRNLSLGTEQFCVGFSNRMECGNLPVNTSKILPKALTSTVGDQIEDFHRLDGILARLSPEYIRDPLIFGLGTAMVIAVVFVCSLFGPHFGLVLHQQDLSLVLILRLVIGLICCLSFLLPTVIVYTLYSNSKRLQSNIKMDRGDVGGYCLMAFFSAIVMTVLTAFTRTFIEKCVA